MDEKVPLTTVPWPMLRFINPNWLVVTEWVSWYTIGPVCDPSRMVARTGNEVLGIGVPAMSRAML
jgi:hypothetical protein